MKKQMLKFRARQQFVNTTSTMALVYILFFEIRNSQQACNAYMLYIKS